MNIYLLQIINGVGIGMLYFLLAVGLSIVFGLLRFVNFSHGAFFLLGAYFCFELGQMGVNFWWTLLIAPLLVGLFAWLVEKIRIAAHLRPAPPFPYSVHGRPGAGHTGSRDFLLGSARQQYFAT